MRFHLRSFSRSRRYSAAVVSGALLALATGGGLVASAQAATYTVGTLKDLAGTCATPASGSCALRQLINYENKLATTPSPPDAIVVPGGQYDLSKGELVITQSLAIVGAGARTTHVDVPVGVAASRVFNIQIPNGGSAPAVVISGLEISGGTANEGNGFFGGDVHSAGQLVLDEDWITEGTASSGGGISNDTGTLVVERSLVSGNHASTGGGDSGGIQNHGSTVKKAVLAVEDSTVTGNDARLGAGIFSWSDAAVGNEVSVINSTIASNSTQSESSGAARGPGAGLLISDGTANVASSILAFNSETAESFTNTNCSTSRTTTIVSLGYNLETEADCGFKSTGDLQNQFGSSLFSSSTPQDNGGNTDTLALEPTSPAIDAIPTSFPLCAGADQRGVTRPQGVGCDIGAVEVVPLTIQATAGSQFSGQVAARPNCGIETRVVPTIDWGDGQASAGTVTETGVSGSHTYAGKGTFNGSVSYVNDCGEHKVAFQAKVAGQPGGGEPPPAPPVPPPLGGVTPGLGVLGFKATLADLPPPVLGKIVDVEPVRGIVLIALPVTGQAASRGGSRGQARESLSKGLKFIPLSEARQIPVGSTLDTSAGVARIETAGTSVGKTQIGDFGAGIFKLLRQRRQLGLTEMNLMNAHSASVCTTVGKKAVVAKHVSSRVLGRLNVSSHGH
ncbi:MAG TPA: choice-of-anchor Q domain-containing protein, partial [Solirubrobacteraceae bacterium]|nr:choice-of-anchor Q domain-containing protein [Solirubrobacteraceae bacterium]